MRYLCLICVCLCSSVVLAAAPTTRPVLTNIQYANTQRLAWASAGLTGLSVDASTTEPKPDLPPWRAFAAAVRDDKPLYRAWAQHDFKFWDADTHTFLLDAEAVTSTDRFTLAQKLAFMETVTRSVKAVAPKLSVAWYADPSLLWYQRTRYPWSADLIGEALRNRDASKRLHGLCDFITIGAYYGDDLIATPEKWTQACRDYADNARLYRLIYPDAKLAWMTMSYANPAWSRPKRSNESAVDYRLALAPSAAQVAELREAVAPYVDAIICWCGELPPLETPGVETFRMIDELVNPINPSRAAP